MPKKANFGQYIAKKVIVEIKHNPDLLFSHKAPNALNEYVEHFDKVVVSGVEGPDKTYQLVSEKIYSTLVVGWNRIGMTLENLKDIDDAKMLLKKFIVPLSNKLGITSANRFGVRTIFLLPFDGSVKDLIDFFKIKIYKDMSLFEPFGKIDDVGLALMTISNDIYKTNLTFGPFSKDEVKIKISDFKQFEENYQSALMIDLDLYQDTKREYKIMAFIQDALDSARIKLVQFNERLMKE